MSSDDRIVDIAAVDVVLPCLDEAGALPAVLGGLPSGWRAVVVDNGSRDGSADVAAAFGACVVTEPRRGFGWACAAGLEAATAPVVAFADADASCDLAELPAVVAPIAEGRADLVLGRRRPTSSGAWPVHARLANGVLAAEQRRTSAAPREGLRALGIRDRRFGYPLEMVLRAAAAGWRIAEVDVSYRPRTGRSKVTGTVRGTVAAVQDMRRVLAEIRP